MRRQILALAAVAALALILAACASGKATGLPAGPTTAPPGKTCSGTVEMQNLLFVPKDCTVTVGTKVTWKNTVGGLPHTVVSEEGKFDSSASSPSIAANGEFTFTFKAAGNYPYYCSLHASKGTRVGMVGTIVVQGSTGSPSPTSS